jgi:acetolactate synthase, small subunit
MSDDRYSPSDDDRTTGELPGPAPDERPQPGGRRNSQGTRVRPASEVEPQPREAVISALVDDEPGVLSRVSGLVSRRKFNIESLTVGPTTVDNHSRITMVVEEPEPGIEQIRKQLAKLKPVISVGELERDAIQQELAMLKVGAEDPDKVQAITEMYDGQTLDAGPETITVQVTGRQDRIDEALAAFERFGIREIARTGAAALTRGPGTTVPGERPAMSDEPTTRADIGSTD